MECKATPQTELAMLKAALDASAIVAFTDQQGKITHVNDNFCRISGYTREELIGQTHRIVNSSYHPREFFAEMWRAISSGRVWKGEIQNRAKSGSLYWVDTTIVPFPGEGPYGSKYVAIRSDITVRKSIQMELETERSRRLFADKMASLGELTAGIAHEIGNPIAAIQGRAEMLKMMIPSERTPFAEQVTRTVGTILSLTSRTEGILRNMRAFARNGEGDPLLSASLKSVLESTVELGSERYRKRGIKVSIEPFDAELTVVCRETQIIQILVNLINNACDAIQTLDEKWIQFSVLNLGASIQILITDSGPGIRGEARTKLFEPFFTTKQVGEGTGLGLHISRQIAEQHGGFLKLDETHPHTRFILSLPSKTEHEVLREPL